MVNDADDRFGMYADLCEVYGPFRDDTADGHSMDDAAANGDSASDDGAERSSSEDGGW